MDILCNAVSTPRDFVRCLVWGAHAVYLSYIKHQASSVIISHSTATHLTLIEDSGVVTVDTPCSGISSDVT